MKRAKHTNNLKKFSLRKNRRKLCLLPPRLDKAPSVSEDLTRFKTTWQSEVLGNRMLYDMLITSIVQEPVNWFPCGQHFGGCILMSYWLLAYSWKHKETLKLQLVKYCDLINVNNICECYWRLFSTGISHWDWWQSKRGANLALKPTFSDKQ